MTEYKITITDHISDVIYEETNVMVPAGGDYKLFVLLVDRLIYHIMSRYIADPDNAPEVIRMYAAITFDNGCEYLSGYKAVAIYNAVSGKYDIYIGFSDEENAIIARSEDPRTYWI